MLEMEPHTCSGSIVTLSSITKPHLKEEKDDTLYVFRELFLKKWHQGLQTSFDS